MPEIIPRLLAPYFQKSLKEPSTTLITSTLSTPGNWILVRLLYTALKGLEDPALPTSIEPQTTNSHIHVVLASLVRPLNLWTELCKKVVSQAALLCLSPFAPGYLIDPFQGLDLPSLLKSARVCYIDGLATVKQADFQQREHAGAGLEQLTLDALYAAILSATNASSRRDSPGIKDVALTTKRIIIIDGLDFLFACQPDVDIVKLQTFLFRVRSLAKAIILTSHADAPLLHNHQDSATPLERHHCALVSSLAYQSQWVMQLRGLNTGSANDITGVLRISEGGAYDDMQDQHTSLDEAEWLYQVKADGSARVWSRGE